MKYDTYAYYCNLVDELHSASEEALFYASRTESTEELRHRTIRMLLERAIRGITSILAREERNNINISPEYYCYFGRNSRNVRFDDDYFDVIEDKEYYR